ncbi:sigma factor-like helix-turn-helix DNA-binding protein [Streptomyces longispororuber]|uniref:sigma factor-like helix-turn-helix DNA-binding protein n=1 Tax=Streptomyces longispororuber TaxID=68230 RepID=UPI0033CB0FE0
MSPQPAPNGARRNPRRGRKLGPISDAARPRHRQWLEQVRAAYHASDLTFRQLAELSHWPRSKISELLRAVGRYPRWEITRDLLVTLGWIDHPLASMRRQWVLAAQEAHKRAAWITDCLDRAGDGLDSHHKPLDFTAFDDTHRAVYYAYASVFLREGDKSKQAVHKALLLLLILWDEALCSANLEQYAWDLLRQTVMEKTPHTDGHPALMESAFDTRALRAAVDPHAQITETLALFDALRRLAPAQLDVMVLRYLRGLSEDGVAHTLGLPLAAVRAAERHAKRHISAHLRTTNEEGHRGDLTP